MKTSGEIEAAVASLADEKVVTRSAMDGRWDIINGNLKKSVSTEVPTVIIKTPVKKDDSQKSTLIKQNSKQAKNKKIDKFVDTPPVEALKKAANLEPKIDIAPAKIDEKVQ